MAHDHAHDHAPADFGRAFAIGIALNVGFVAVEAGYGLASGSLALVADAGHNASDVLGLLLAWGAAWAVKRRPTTSFTFGWRRSSIMAALINAVALLMAVAVIAVEAVHRFGEPRPIATNTVMAVAAAGIAVNGITAWLFARGRKGDLNIRAAFQHMVADAAVSAGVVVAAFAIARTGWLWLDPVVSIAIAALIAVGSWGLLKESARLSLDAVPEGVDCGAIETYLQGLPGVTAVHHLHVWPISTTEIALTVHLDVAAAGPHDALLHRIGDDLGHRFNIAHPTIQIETDAAACAFGHAHA